MDFLPIFQKMVELFFIIILGYIAAKAKVINKQGKQSLSKLVLNVTMPCTILNSVINSNSLPGKGEILYLMLVAFLSYIPLFLLGLIVPRIGRFHGSLRGVAFFAMMFGNVGFIGYPVVEAIYGSDAVFYACVFNMPFNLLCYSLGVYVLQKYNGADDQVIDISWSKLLITPGLITSVVAIILAMIQVDLPAVICEPVGLVSNITTPAALIIIGITLSEMPFVEMFNNFKAYVLTFYCIIVSPIVTYLVFAPFTKGMVLRIAVILAAMPVATAGTMLCVEYKCDERFMAQITFLSTLFTIVTIPLFAVVMEML